MTLRSVRLVNERDPHGPIAIEFADGTGYVVSRAEWDCLTRRRTHSVAGDGPQFAHAVWMNSHRMRRHGMGDGKVWMLSRDTGRYGKAMREMQADMAQSLLRPEAVGP